MIHSKIQVLPPMDTDDQIQSVPVGVHRWQIVPRRRASRLGSARAAASSHPGSGSGV
jgi:hypothetical protein